MATVPFLLLIKSILYKPTRLRSKEFAEKVETSLPWNRENEEPSTTDAGIYQPVVREPGTRAAFPICSSGEGGPERCYEDSKTDWARYVEMADRHYEPGVLTTFAAYEFSPTVPDGKHHRNVIFNGTDQLPDQAVSSLDVANALDLWRALEEA